MDFVSNHILAVMPPQKLSFSKKNEEWKKQCVQAISSLGNTRYVNGRTSWARKQANYDLVNSIIDEHDFNYVLDPYGLGNNNPGSQPSRLRDINLIVNKLNLLKGEEMNRPFNFQVIAVNGEAVTEKDNMKKQILMEVAMAKLAKEAGIPLSVVEDPNRPQTFEQVEKYATSSMKDIREEWGNSILTYLKYKEQLQLRFNEGWEHGLIAAEEVYYIGIVNGEPKVRVCNPLNCEFDRNPDNPNIEDGDWFREDRWMTVGQILDEYGEFLTEEQLTRLDRGELRRNLSNQMFPGYAYTQDDIRKYERGNFATRSRSNSTHMLVTHVVWKSWKKIGFVEYIDENEDLQSSIVDETFKLTPEMKAAGYKLEWRWIPEVWHGTKIAEDFFVNIEPMPNQSRSMDNPSEVKLPYVGRIYNSVNSVQTSMVDLIKPHQYLYNIIWFRLEAELAKAKGKKMVMDIAQIPKSQGIDMDKWMYYFDNVGIAFINSFEEGMDKFQGQVSQFNQYTSIDMGLSQAVGQYVQILSKIEQLIDKVVGITPQREGSTMATETATGVQASMTQSSHITEPWFYIHNEIKRKVLTQLLETAKFAYPSSKKLQYIVDDVQRISVEIDIDKFSDSDYGVFASNSSKDNLIFQKLEVLAEKAMSAGAASFSDIIKMYKANSISELSRLIETSEQQKQQRDSEQLQIQQQMQQEQLQANAAEKDKDRMFQAQENQLDRENNIREAVIKTMGFDQDIQNTGANEIVEQGKLALEQEKHASDQEVKQRTLDQQAAEADKDRQLKREEMASKEKIEKRKASVALKNKVSGEK